MNSSLSPRALVRHDEDPAGSVLGGKAGALAALERAFPVPEWFVVTPRVFLECAGPEGGDPAQVRLTPEWRERIISAARELAPASGHAAFAVRSSASDEDGAGHSFAGQFDTFLHVAPDQLADKIEAVWRSGWSERVLAYRRERGVARVTIPPAVLVQRMVDADAAGVAFSADPVSGRRAVAVVSAVFGLGTALVGGDADADTYSVSRDGAVLERRIALKYFAHRAAPDSPEGVAAVTLPENQWTQPAITDAQAVAIAALARATAAHFGRPQDIEWAIEQGKLYLLQSRPITSLAGLADPDGARAIWDNANIAESYSGVTTPLTFSFARTIYEEVYRQFCRVMGVRAATIDANRDLFPRMLGLVEGRVYYNLLSWYRLIALLPGFQANRGFMEQMMGVKEALPDEVVAALPQTTWASRARDRIAVLKTFAGLVRNHRTLPRQVAQFYGRLNDALRPPNPPLAEMRPDELVAHYRDLESRLLLKWDAPIVNDFFAMIFYGVLRKLTAKWCGDAAGTLQNDLLCGEGGLISAEPAKRVRELAGIAARDPDVVALLCEGSLREMERWLDGAGSTSFVGRELAPGRLDIARPAGLQSRSGPEQAPALQGTHAAEFRAKYQEYLERFGDRCLEELKLESRTLHEEPLTLLRSIGQFARRFGAAGLAQESGLEAKLRAEAETRAAQALRGSPVKRMLFNWVLRHARARVKERENLRFERTRLFGRVRRIFLELGRRFWAAGKLDEPRDVFWLEVEEVLGFVEGRTTTADLRGLTAVRRAEFTAYKTKAPAPADRFETHGAVHLGNKFQATPKSAASADASTPANVDELRGIGCCPGIVRGPARVILDPRHAEIRAGEILVAPRTDPGWIMLFPSASGLLVEYGSLLSHSAIVAREMGIPAVVSMTGLTTWVKTGEWIEMDGSTGVVRKISAPSDPVGGALRPDFARAEDRGLKPLPQCGEGEANS